MIDPLKLFPTQQRPPFSKIKNKTTHQWQLHEGFILYFGLEPCSIKTTKLRWQLHWFWNCLYLPLSLSFSSHKTMKSIKSTKRENDPRKKKIYDIIHSLWHQLERTHTALFIGPRSKVLQIKCHGTHIILDRPLRAWIGHFHSTLINYSPYPLISPDYPSWFWLWV